MATTSGSSSWARRAQRLAFVLLATVAATCGVVIATGGWNTAATMGAATGVAVLAAFVAALSIAVQERGQAPQA